MPTVQFLVAYLAARAERTERGSGTVDWMILAILAVIVGGALIIGMTGIGDGVIARIEEILT